MEEDIKIIEEIIEVYRSCSVDEEGFDMRVDIAFMKKECKALENLLTRYKQLEEENERLNNHNIIGRIDAIKIEDLEPVLKPYYIPKSKVKEKIEELKTYRFTSSKQAKKGYDDKIRVLQELLREE